MPVGDHSSEEDALLAVLATVETHFTTCPHANKEFISSLRKFYRDQLETTNTDPRQRWTVVGPSYAASNRIAGSHVSHWKCTSLCRLHRLFRQQNLKYETNNTIDSFKETVWHWPFAVRLTPHWQTARRAATTVCRRSQQADSQRASEVICNGPYSYICNQIVCWPICTVDCMFCCSVFHRGNVPGAVQGCVNYSTSEKEWVQLLHVHQLSTNIESTYNFEDHRANYIVKSYRVCWIIAELQLVSIRLPTWLINRLLNDVYINTDQKSRTLLLQLDMAAASIL